MWGDADDDAEEPAMEMGSYGKYGGWRIMQSPSWKPQCVRSLASPCCARKLVVGNPPGYCNCDVRASDARRKDRMSDRVG